MLVCIAIILNYLKDCAICFHHLYNFYKFLCSAMLVCIAISLNYLKDCAICLSPYL